MNKKTFFRCAALLLALQGFNCINVHIYFPEAQLQEAAADIVNEVRPDMASAPPAGANEKEASAPQGVPGQAETGAEGKTSGVLFRLLAVRAAHAEEGKKERDEAKKIQLDVQSPVIKKIKDTLKARYAKLLPFYEKGAVGEGVDGYLALRETKGLNLKEQRDAQGLLKEENEDRRNLYTQIARGNGIDESLVPNVAKLFSAEWQKKSKTGWWIEKDGGKWEKKADEKGK